MKNLKLTPKNLTLIAFVAIEIIIYIVFNVLFGVLSYDPIYVKYCGVLLCLATSGALLYFLKLDKDALTVFCALIFTAVSDLFILVLDKYYEVGLVTFIITQSIYLYRLYSGRVNKIWITLIVRAVLAAVAIGIVGGLSTLNFLVVEVAIYIVMLTANCVEAFLLFRRGRYNILFAVGLLLFLCCDICVGLDNAGSVLGLNLPKGLYAFTSWAIWIFYMPSQVLITLSVNKNGVCGGKSEILSEGDDVGQAEENS